MKDSYSNTEQTAEPTVVPPKIYKIPLLFILYLLYNDSRLKNYATVYSAYLRRNFVF